MTEQWVTLATNQALNNGVELAKADRVAIKRQVGTKMGISITLFYISKILFRIYIEKFT